MSEKSCTFATAKVYNLQLLTDVKQERCHRQRKKR